MCVPHRSDRTCKHGTEDWVLDFALGCIAREAQRQDADASFAADPLAANPLAADPLAAASFAAGAPVGAAAAPVPFAAAGWGGDGQVPDG